MELLAVPFLEPFVVSTEKYKVFGKDKFYAKKNPFSKPSEKLHHRLEFINATIFNRMSLFLYLCHHTKKTPEPNNPTTVCSFKR